MFEQDLNAEKNQDDTSASSAFALYLVPNMFPIFTPAAAMINVITPINETAGIICTFKKAKVMPTAKASILSQQPEGTSFCNLKGRLKILRRRRKLRGSY